MEPRSSTSIGDDNQSSCGRTSAFIRDRLFHWQWRTRRPIFQGAYSCLGPNLMVTSQLDHGSISKCEFRCQSCAKRSRSTDHHTLEQSSKYAGQVSVMPISVVESNSSSPEPDDNDHALQVDSRSSSQQPSLARMSPASTIAVAHRLPSCLAIKTWLSNIHTISSSPSMALAGGMDTPTPSPGMVFISPATLRTMLGASSPALGNRVKGPNFTRASKRLSKCNKCRTFSRVLVSL